MIQSNEIAIAVVAVIVFWVVPFIVKLIFGDAGIQVE